MEIEKLCGREYILEHYDKNNKDYKSLMEKIPYESTDIFNNVIESIFRAGFKSGINFALEVLDKKKWISVNVGDGNFRRLCIIFYLLIKNILKNKQITLHF